uniref:Uncharacterized protein n=1 Tax=Candidatus Nitrotoga fabula TaxID=2182327 RepID=A0A2X0SJJ0_9PROT|nr:protein of unknown function [Candidatus Nitrotoga fabula]
MQCKREWDSHPDLLKKVTMNTPVEIQSDIDPLRVSSSRVTLTRAVTYHSPIVTNF